MLRVGRLSGLDDPTALSESGSGNEGRNLSLDGDEASSTTLTVAGALRRRSDLLGLRGRVEPVTWTEDSSLDGFYRITDVDAELAGLTATTARVGWSMSLERVGIPADVEIESRITGATLTNDHGLTGQKWHAPPNTHRAYYVGTASPATTTRAHSAGGTITLYLDLPAATDARYLLPSPGSYYDQAAEITTDSVPVTGIGDYPLATAFRIQNGLVNFRLGGNNGDTIPVQFWDGTAWAEKNFNLRIGGTNVQWAGAITVLRNDAEECSVRLYALRTFGRATLDVTLRRGARYLALYAQNYVAGTFRLTRAGTEASTAIPGAIHASAAGLRYVIGSARTFTSSLTTGYIERASTTTFDAFVGFEGAGGGAGNLAADLVAQYLSGMSETQTVIRR